MPTQGPLILLQSSHDRAGGIVPPGLLAQAAAEAGYRSAAIIDSSTLRGGPAFLDACTENHLVGLAGIAVRTAPRPGLDPARVPDVFDLPRSTSEAPVRAGERIALLAANQAGYRNLLRIKQAADLSADSGLAPEGLLEYSEGVFLVAGLAGSALCRNPLTRTDSQRFGWMLEFLGKWPRDQAGLCCFDSRTGRIIETVASPSARPPLPIPPLACVCAAYRSYSDRFWGCAARLGHQENLTNLRDLPGRIPRAERVTRLLQGLSASFRGVEKLISRPFDPYQRSGLSFPIYPVPRGTDVASFFWTLGQETAIATGHIRREGVKDRLVEEYQYLKQTRWPTVWLILWDVRKRLGLPPGTLRPSAEWISSSLFAHLLGLTRIDPSRERIPFRPDPQTPLGGPVNVDCPQQWESEVLSALEALLGRGRCGFASPVEIDRDELLRGGYRLLTSWEDLEFPGDPPEMIPPLPSFLDQGDTSGPGDSIPSLIVSGVNLEQVFAPTVGGYPHLDASPGDALSLGTLAFRLAESNAQTLSSAPLYRGAAQAAPRHEEARESITTWIEKHRGEAFLDQGYADDTGKVEVLGLSSSLLRLLTLPGSTGYRPLLWKWIHLTAPTRIGELADLLALAWHWTFWSQRETLRLLAAQRDHPLRSEGGMPPWWADWSKSADEGGLDSRPRGDFGVALEKATAGTGGWLLYREQIHQVGASALRLTPEEMDLWLSLEEGNLHSDPSPGRDPRVWDRDSREAVVQFLGNPNPLPSRLEFLRKAEQLLAVADAFARDPAAVTSVLSYLYPEETEERRELYSLLRVRGLRIEPPRAIPGGRYDCSPSEDLLRLGTLNILGVGPQISVDLEAPFPVSMGEANLRGMLRPSASPTDLPWEDWLKTWPEHRLSWNLLSQLIRLGVFGHFGRDPGTLLEVARSHHLSQRAHSGGATQQTLFPVRPEPPPASSSRCEQEGSGPPLEGQLELSLLRLGVTQNPLEPFKQWLPPEWFLEGPATGRPDSLQMGWIQEVDVFASTAEPEPGTGTQPPWLTFLLFNQEGVYRVVDELGKVLSVLPLPAPEPPRLDGHRLHLKGPWPILCEVVSRPYTEQGLPQYLLKECEVPFHLARASESWSQIQVVLDDSSSELLDHLSLLLKWFSVQGRGVPLILENGAGLLKRSGVRRMISRLGPPRVVPSTVLVSRLRNLRGVARVEVVQGQADLFAVD